MTVTSDQLRLHPCFARCLTLYMAALRDWQANYGIRLAAKTIGMSSRGYANGRLEREQFQWTDSSTGEPFTIAHADLAYADAADAIYALNTPTTHPTPLPSPLPVSDCRGLSGGRA